MQELFRVEALSQQRQRLFGDVVITTGRGSTIFAGAMVLVGAGLLLCGLMGRYPRTEVAAGSVVTSIPSTKIMTPRAGLATRVAVRDGQLVKAGDVLAAVSTDATLEDGHAAGTDSVASIDRQIAITAQQRLLLDTTFNEERARLKDQIAANRREHADLQAQINLQSEILASARMIHERMATVAANGYVSRFDLERRRQEMLRAEQELRQLQQQDSGNGGRRADLEAQALRLTSEREKQIAELGTARENFSQQRSQTQGQATFLITAPSAGRISALNAAVGRSVDPRIPLMTVVPDNARFEAELYAPSRAVGFVRAGQTVKVMYDAFPYRQFGAFDGTIINVSRSISLPNEIDVPVRLEEAVYRIRVRLPQQSIPSAGGGLQSGMTLKANIILEQRSFVDWLLEPLRAVKNRT